MNQLPPEVRWSTPEDALRDAAGELCWSMLGMSIRLLAITGLLLWATYHWLAPLFRPDVPWGRMSTMLLDYAGGWPIAVALGTFIDHREPAE